MIYANSKLFSTCSINQMSQENLKHFLLTVLIALKKLIYNIIYLN